MEATKREYVIVEFPEEQMEGGTIPIALISSTWIFEKEGILLCYWPTYLKTTNKRERAVQGHSELIIEKCNICPIKVKYSTAHYDLANVKLKTMEEEGSSQSENSDGGFLSQRLRPSTKKPDYDYNLSPSDDDESYVPPAPKPARNLSFLKKYTDVVPSQLQKSQESQNVEVPVTRTFTNLTPLKIQDTLEDLSVDGAVGQKPIQCSCDKNTKMLTHLLKEMLSIKRDVQQLLLISEKEAIQTLPEVDIPKCGSAEDLYNFNEALKKDQYFQKCVIRLGLIGGKDSSETTRMILVNIIKHNLALQMNFSGKNNKLGLQASENILALIKASVRKNPAAAAATDSQIIQAIMIWLRNAPDREGGRTKRKISKEKQVDES